MLWGQCTQIVQNEPQAVENFEEMDEEHDPMTSMKNIKKLTNDFRDKRHVFGSMWHAQKQLCNCTQKEDEDIEKHHDGFKNQVETMENHGGTLCTEEQFLKNDKNTKTCQNLN